MKPWDKQNVPLSIEEMRVLIPLLDACIDEHLRGVEHDDVFLARVQDSINKMENVLEDCETKGEVA
jgi:hypothetical protein